MIRQPAQRPSTRRVLTRASAVVAIAFVGSIAVVAQPAFQSSASLLDGLRACRALTSEGERVSCYDAKVGALLGAVEAGDVRLVDREAMRQTRRQLFGITMPDVDILKGDDKDEEVNSEMLETTIASGRQIGPNAWRFTTTEGAVWEINSPPRKLAPIKEGDKVVFKRASFGYYFIRINGQIGVKGRRVS
jgi:hypothetical protein